MSQTTTEPGSRGRRGARFALAVVAALCALGALAGTAGATGSQQQGDSGYAGLSITKQTDPAGDPTVFNFKVEFTAHPGDACAEDPDPAIVGCRDGNEVPVPATFTLTGGQTKDFGHIHKGYYTVSELTQSGWKLVDIQCAPTDADPNDAYQVDLTAGSVKIELSNGETKGCTFKNTKEAPPVPPTVRPPDETISGTPPTPVAPAQSVLPITLRPGSARLAAPALCVSRRYSLTVTGGPVKSVSWWVNGRYIKRTPARNGHQQVFRTTFLPGAHLTRVQARVTFASNSTVRSRTLNATIRRCSPAVVRPQFTG